MGLKTKIPWCDHSWNPWYGCRKVSTGCLHCYAERDMRRYGKNFNSVTVSRPATFLAPLNWKGPADVFCCSWSDFFIVDADKWRAQAWEIIQKTPQLRYLILTKRSERILDNLPAGWDTYVNVLFGVTIEHSQNIRRLFYHNDFAKTSFISAEPLLDDVAMGLRSAMLKDEAVAERLTQVKQIIVGCESGTPYRETKIEWVRNLREFCLENNIRFFLKQLRDKNGVLVEMPELDGKTWNERI